MKINSYRDLKVWQKAMELETHWLIAICLSYVEEKKTENLMSLAAEIGRMLQGLMNKLTPETCCLLPITYCLLRQELITSLYQQIEFLSKP